MLTKMLMMVAPDETPADLVLDLWVLHEVSEGEQVVGGKEDGTLVEDLHIVQ
jgi:hypothetical protein